MRSDSTSFVEKNIAKSKDIRFVIEQSFDTSNTVLRYFLSHDDAAYPWGATAYAGVVKAFSFTSQRLDPITGNSTIGDITYSIVDVDSDITTLLSDQLASSRSARKKRVRLYVGYKDLEWDDYTLIQTQFVDRDVTYKDGLYTFSCSDIQREARTKIFKPKETNIGATVDYIATTLDGSHNNSITTLTVKSTTDFPSTGTVLVDEEEITYTGKGSTTFTGCTRGANGTSAASHNDGAKVEQTAFTITAVATSSFEMVAHDASYSDAASSTVGYFEIQRGSDREIFRYTGKTSTTFTGCRRGRFGTRPMQFVYDATIEAARNPKIKEYIYLEGPLVKILYAIRTGALYGQGGAELPSHWHLGTSTDYVRLADFTNYGTDWWDTSDPTKGFQVRFQGLQEQDGKTFCERELQLLLGAFGPIYADGAVGLKKMAAVLSSSGYVAHLTESNIVGYGELKHDYQRVYNSIQIEWNYDDVAQKFTRIDLFEDTDSQAIYERSDKYIIQFRGLIGDIHTTSMLLNQFAALRDRYAGPPLMAPLQLLPSLNSLEVGDVVRVDLDHIRDYTGSETAIDRTFEIQQISIDWFRGAVNVELFGSSKLAKWVPLDATTGSAVGNSYYTSSGTNLTSVLTISAGAVTASGTITGASTMASARYYYDGDLTIGSGLVVTATQNVLLFIKGYLQIDGVLTTAGQGHAGAAQPAASTPVVGQTIPSANLYTSGTQGVIGATHAGGYFVGYDDYPGLVVNGLNVTIPQTNVLWDGSAIQGLPTDLRGSSGSSGGTAFERSSYQSPTWDRQSRGGAGGDGGGGLIIVCRGIGFGTNGKIDVSGEPGQHADVATNIGSTSTYLYRGGGGAGGAPGGCLLVIDGNNVTYPSITTSTFIAKYGITPIDGVLGLRDSGAGSEPNTFTSRYVGVSDIRASSGGALSGVTQYSPPDASGPAGGHVRVVYIEIEQTAEPDVPSTSDAAAALTVSEATNTPQTPAENLATLTVTATAPSDTNYSHSNIYYRVAGSGDPFFLAGPANNQRTIVAAMDGTAYEIEARAVSQTGVESPTGLRRTITMSNTSGGVSLGNGNYVAITKTSFADTTEGLWIGKNGSGATDFYIGNASKWVKWINATATLDISGTITATSGAIGGWTINSTTITNGAGTITLDSSNNRIQLGSGASDYVRLTPTALVGVSALLGTTFNLPTDGSAPTFASGTINSTTFNITSSGILRTSSTVGDGSGSSQGVLINDTGIKLFPTSSSTPTVHLKATDGSIEATKGTIAGWTLSSTTFANGTNIVLDSSNKAISINDATYGNEGIQLQYNSGTPRMYVGDGSDKFLEFDGADVNIGRDSQLLGADAFSNSNYYFHTWCNDNLDRYDSTGTKPTVNGTGWYFFAANLENIMLYFNPSSGVDMNWSKARRVKFAFRAIVTSNDWDVSLGSGNQWIDGTFKGFGFKLDNSLALKGYTSDGSTTNTVDLSTTLVDDTTYILMATFTPGSHVEWFIDGTSIATTSTNIPTTGTDTSGQFFHARLKSTAYGSKAFSIAQVWALQEP
jgi:hypothetical protein